MKKLYLSHKYKRYNKRHARRSLEARLRYQEYLRKKRISEQGLTKSVLKSKREHESKFKNFEHVYAPTNFSLIDNTIEVIEFIDKLQDHYNSKRKVFIVLKNVERIKYDAIVVLLSIMVKFKASKIDFNGDFPKNTKARKLLEESGFFSNLFKTFREEERYDIGNKKIHTHAWKNVDSVLGSKLIEKASLHIWGEKYRYPGCQRTLIELMQNTNNHADLYKEGEKHWWISLNPLDGEKKAVFSFVDFGIGIFKSLENKSPGSKFFKWKEKIKRKFKYGDNAELLKLILNGDFHEVVTGKHFRGKGLPGIHEAMKRNQLTNLHIISNNVFANVAKEEFYTLNKDFNGTFIYWELNDRTNYVQ